MSWYMALFFLGIYFQFLSCLVGGEKVKRLKEAAWSGRQITEHLSRGLSDTAESESNSMFVSPGI